jgi:hypothetical protein
MLFNSLARARDMISKWKWSQTEEIGTQYTSCGGEAPSSAAIPRIIAIAY